MCSEKILTVVAASLESVWKVWNDEKHIIKWYQTSDDWSTVWVLNDLQVEGEFRSRMEQIDGPLFYEFIGIYEEIHSFEYIRYGLKDGKKVEVVFVPLYNQTKIILIFDGDGMHQRSIQQEGWQNILDGFKSYINHLELTETL